MKSGGLVGGDADAAPNETHLTPRHVAFLDLDRLYFELERFKAERGWYNLNLTRQGVEALLGDQSYGRGQALVSGRSRVVPAYQASGSRPERPGRA